MAHQHASQECFSRRSRLPTSAETLAGRIHHECLRRTLAHANVAAAASVALTWIVTPNVVVTLALFGFAAVVVAARTVVGTAHGFVVAGERKLEVGAARSAITHAGYLAGSFVGGAAPGIGGHSAVGFVFGLLFLGATIPYLSAWHAHCPRSGPLSLVSARPSERITGTSQKILPALTGTFTPQRRMLQVLRRGGDVMYARIATFEGDPANIDEAISNVKGNVEGGSPPPGLENARGMMMLVNRETGKGMGVTLFENEDELKRGDEALNSMNPGGGGRRTSVEFYEVAIQRM
jgi:hypothetical protein